ncbi:transmembrane protein 272-like isoform X1 [Dreissena polymorpha]|uniref:transmembrane protein 272-like isoform X1 n=1 Tax=Dreissena polymorpha TaxID=45954 RepID=UPI0022656F11|nr:transmembrane protein 272-like isoform X1 [Dreissena polymorpha]
MGRGKGGEEYCVACGAAVLCCCVTVLAVGLAGLGIAKIVMGAIYLHHCDIEKMIPIYLIVSGVVPLFFSSFSRRDEDRGFGVADICGLLAFLFNTAWLVCGSIWVYPNYGKLTSDQYIPCSETVKHHCVRGTCSMTFMTFAFSMVTIDWICFGLGMAFLASVYCRAACRD